MTLPLPCRSEACTWQQTPADLTCPQDPSDDLTCDVDSWDTPSGEVVALTVSGDLDMFTYPIAATALAHALTSASRHLVVDLTGLRFCSVRGLALFADAALTAAAQNTTLVLSGLTTRNQRHLDLLDAPSPATVPSGAHVVSAIRRSEVRGPH